MFKINAQGRFLVVKGNMDDNMFTIVDIYAPNRDRSSRLFFESLQRHLEEFRITNEDNIVIGGDFNCPLNPQLDKMGGILIPRANVVGAIEGIQNNFNLHDVWRIKNPEVKSFTWSQNLPFVFCRLDYWLTSAHLFYHINNVDICPAIKPDHSMITLEFKMIEKHLKGPGSWKLNVSLLMNEHYVNAMESNIPIWKEDSQKHFADSKMSWEWIKFKIREFSLDFSKKLARK